MEAPKTQKPKFVKKRRKLKAKLYTESEVAQHTELQFREVWVVIGPTGKYAYAYLNGESKDERGVCKYHQDRGYAQQFKTYADARKTMDTLNTTLKGGHSMKRFFLPTGAAY